MAHLNRSWARRNATEEWESSREYPQDLRPSPKVRLAHIYGPEGDITDRQLRVRKRPLAEKESVGAIRPGAARRKGLIVFPQSSRSLWMPNPSPPCVSNSLRKPSGSQPARPDELWWWLPDYLNFTLSDDHRVPCIRLVRPTDLPKAMEWYRISAEAGYMIAPGRFAATNWPHATLRDCQVVESQT
jgi:hypothetical protein